MRIATGYTGTEICTPHGKNIYKGALAKIGTSTGGINGLAGACIMPIA